MDTEEMASDYPDMCQAIEFARDSNQVIQTPSSELVAFNESMLSDTDIIKKFCTWRADNLMPFLKVFQPTFEGTTNWARSVCKAPDRILWLVRHEGVYVGHLGYGSFAKGFEVCDVVRGIRSNRDVMKDSLTSLIDWAKSSGAKNIVLHVAADQGPALGLYHRAGFHPTHLVPLEKQEQNGDVLWTENTDMAKQWNRFLIRMEHGGN
jgi:hypothetical protein